MTNYRKLIEYTQTHSCVLLLFRTYILASACYPCLCTYIIYLGSYLRVYCSHALKGSYFCLRANYLKSKILVMRMKKEVLLLIGVQLHTSIKFKSSCTVLCSMYVNISRRNFCEELNFLCCNKISKINYYLQTFLRVINSSTASLL